MHNLLCHFSTVFDIMGYKHSIDIICNQQLVFFHFMIVLKARHILVPESPNMKITLTISKQIVFVKTG